MLSLFFFFNPFALERRPSAGRSGSPAKHAASSDTQAVEREREPRIYNLFLAVILNAVVFMAEISDRFRGKDRLSYGIGLRRSPVLWLCRAYGVITYLHDHKNPSL